jgi:hypothetical protein
LFVIEHTSPSETIVMKVHIWPQAIKEFSDQQVSDAVQNNIASWRLGFQTALNEDMLPDEAVEVRQFSANMLIKVFLRLKTERGKAKILFERLFREHEIRIEGKSRRMRCYLVVAEGRMMQLTADYEEHLRLQATSFDPLLVDVSAVKHASSYGSNSFGSWRRDVSFQNTPS